MNLDTYAPESASLHRASGYDESRIGMTIKDAHLMLGSVMPPIPNMAATSPPVTGISEVALPPNALQITPAAFTTPSRTAGANPDSLSSFGLDTAARQSG